VVGKTRCKVARRMAQWASLQDDEQQQGAGESNTPINQNGPPSNDEIPHPLMDCGQGKNMSDEGGVGVDVAVGVGVDVASRKNGKRTSDGEDDATGNDSAEDVTKAITGINYPIAGAPHPFNKPLRLRICESIPPPLHEATPPSGGSKSVRFAIRRCNLQRHLLTVQPHLWVVQSRCALHRHLLTVQSHPQVAQ